MTLSISRDNIADTYEHIRDCIRLTPIFDVCPADFRVPAEKLTLKLELFQHTGSFKTRGAFTHLASRTIPTAGVTAASGGNHGAAVAFAASRYRSPARIFVPSYASQAKTDRIQTYGGEVVNGGDNFSDVLDACNAYAARSGARNIHAYDARETIMGQGTLGLELQSQSPSIETLLVSVGGGGLIGGVSAWYQDQLRIVGVEPESSCALHTARAAGRPVNVSVSGIAADSLGAQRIGDLNFSLAEAYVDEIVLVDDSAIANAQSILWQKLRILAEPGGATALSALLSGAYQPRANEHVGVIVCGGNLSIAGFA
ncbi:MAG: threonine/serine dehydratase [Hyphomicrobiaceae bacterium]